MAHNPRIVAPSNECAHGGAYQNFKWCVAKKFLNSFCGEMRMLRKYFHKHLIEHLGLQSYCPSDAGCVVHDNESEHKRNGKRYGVESFNKAYGNRHTHGR